MHAPIIGTAGWAIPRAANDVFGEGGSVLQRYATRFGGVEINSSFYRPHRRATWERWRDATPAAFRFSAKIPKSISHERKLIDCREPLLRFLDEVGGLGDKLAVLLLQLPPRLAFDAAVADDFLTSLTRETPVRIVCEPRHASWFADDAETLLRAFEVARVAADPAIVPAAGVPGGWRGLTYLRLHGSPVTYRSPYDDATLAILARSLRDAPTPPWCIFDNTAAGAATGDALRLGKMLAD